MAPVVPAMRELVDQPLKELSKLYENSLKAMLVCGLEFYLSASMVASFFQCPDENMDADQELQTLYTLAWVPMVLSITLVYGPKTSLSFFPSPEHFERNMLRCKIFTWMYAFVLLIWDPDMVFKTGPSLGVSILFCITDLGRFIMDMKHLTSVEYDENGNSFIIKDKTTEQGQGLRNIQQHFQQPQQKQNQSYTTHSIEISAKVPGRRANYTQKQSCPAERILPEQETVTPQCGTRQQRPCEFKSDPELALDQTPSTINSQYMEALEPDAKKEANEQFAKKSFTYEF
ncbi:hypothetical protein CCR75_008237 [Bremia lactucae]|uniref:Uncharacterized protein n=1 Tax=Bremia lactucae TaxID=4779 RepID=A0A976FJ05_BRELC|nr:hypothetical protein CCR75_008237 [Bremia lactucae]